MKVSLRALKNFFDFSGTPQELANILAGLGFPNDGVTMKGEGLSQVLVGKILSRNKHPQADKLSLLEVDIGREKLPIVCGAQNMKAGDFVALAPVGARIPGKDGSGLVMKEAKIRGETSKGMCCSEAELRLSDESDGIWLLSPSVVSDSDLGQPVSKFFDLEDAIFEIDVTPNRGDALSLRGLAREIVAKLGQKLKPLPIIKWKSPSALVSPSIENFADASGFAACLVQGVTVKPTPASWQSFLSTNSARSISNLVDVTNIVLFEIGHPIHFFDAEKVDAKTIGVRRAREGEKLTLLNDQTIDLHPDDLVIADASGPLSLAGVMGGKASSVTEVTKSILIEAASFNPALIRATARRHNISSESSYRFERGVTPHRLDEVIERALALVKDLSGFERAEGSKVVNKDLILKGVLWDRARVEGKLGKLSLTDDQIFEMLRRLDYGFEPKGSTTRVVFPWYRTDCEFLEDVMEDIARLIGYEELPRARLKMEESELVWKNLQPTFSIADRAVDHFVSLGFSEAVHMSFGLSDVERKMGFDSQAVELVNPIHSEKSKLRRSLLPQLLTTAKMNLAYGEEDIRIVEWGPVFRSDIRGLYEESPRSESFALALVWLPRPSDKKQMWKKELDPFFELKGWVESVLGRVRLKPLKQPKGLLHPTRSTLFAGGSFGELHPLHQKMLDLPSRAFVGEWLIEGGEKAWAFDSPAQFPAVDFDLSLVIPKTVTSEKMLSVFQKAKPKILEEVRVYDLFEGGSLPSGKKSMTFALRYRDPSKTLTLEEAKKAHDEVVSQVIKAFPVNDVAVR